VPAGESHRRRSSSVRASRSGTSASAHTPSMFRQNNHRIRQRQEFRSIGRPRTKKNRAAESFLRDDLPGGDAAGGWDRSFHAVPPFTFSGESVAGPKDKTKFRLDARSERILLWGNFCRLVRPLSALRADLGGGAAEPRRKSCRCFFCVGRRWFFATQATPDRVLTGRALRGDGRFFRASGFSPTSPTSRGRHRLALRRKRLYGFRRRRGGRSSDSRGAAG